MKTILCYGDSNTWGYIPGGLGRYNTDVRWTGVVQNDLGANYRIIEEGLNGRTTVYNSAFDDDLNGKTHLRCALMSHMPLDAAVLMLGKNDLAFGHTAWEAASGAKALLGIIQSAHLCFAGSKANVLLVAPIRIGANVKEVNWFPACEQSYAESLLFAQHYQRVADRLDVAFLDAAAYAEPSQTDAVHMDPDSHAALGHVIAKKLLEMLR